MLKSLSFNELSHEFTKKFELKNELRGSFVVLNLIFFDEEKRLKIEVKKADRERIKQLNIPNVESEEDEDPDNLFKIDPNFKYKNMETNINQCVLKANNLLSSVGKLNKIENTARECYGIND